MEVRAVQYVSDEHGKLTAVLVPMEMWREVASELETQHLLSSPVMRERLLRAMKREGGYSLDEVLERFGISQEELEAEEQTTPG